MKKIENKISYKYNFKVYLGFLKKYKLAVFWLLLLIFFIESLYIIDKFLFKIIIDKGTDFASGVLGKEIYTKILLSVAAVYLVILISRAISNFFRVGLINRLESKIIIDLKRKYFSHILNLPYSFHTTHKTGSLISRLTRSGGAVERMTDVIAFNFAPTIFQIIVVSASLAYFSIMPAIVVFSVSITFVSYSLLIQHLEKEPLIFANKKEDIEKGNIADVFTNIDSVKYFGKENFILRKISWLMEETKKAMLNAWDYYRWFDSGQTLILGLGTFFLIYFPLTQFLRGEITIGTIVFVYTAYIGIIGSLFGFVHGIRNYYRSMADFQDLFEYGKIQNNIIDGKESSKVRKGEIEFKNIDFSFGKKVLFKNFNLKIPEGKKIALVGHSGSGKTTLVRLLYRFYDIDSGEILVDGKNIKNFKKQSLRSEMSIVPQECVLFDDTIFSNIRFSKPFASKEDVLIAMRFAQLDRVVSSFPKKENTIVGERGVRLSGGEKQRVSIARAILADKKILVLDEATSALDSQTEYDIQRDLEKLMEGRTSIIIAHRLSTIMKADQIIVLDKGKIVQKGTHNQLIRQIGQYRKLWDLQKGGYIK